jgi:hypothetical protein
MNTTNTTTSTPQTWSDLFKSDQPIDFQAFLQSDLLAEARRKKKTVAIVRHMAGSISIIASAAIIWHILRSYMVFPQHITGWCSVYASLILFFSFAIASSNTRYQRNWNMSCHLRKAMWRAVILKVSSLL